MAIRWDKFTIKAQEAIQQANELASQNGNPEMLPFAYAGGAVAGQRRHCCARADQAGRESRDRCSRR